MDRPAWLVADLRWSPVGAVEVGLARNAVFGGSVDGDPRPVDWGQVVLPTRPHVAGDPDQSEADTDERVAWDLTLRPRFPAVLGFDAARIFVQHGGEDVVTRSAGALPWPTLGGSANVYGASLHGARGRIGGEWAVIEDDLYRWYTGHRVYHDGWTADGVSLGYPGGGDQRVASVYGAWTLGDRAEIAATAWHARQVQVADRVDGTVFVFPAAEVHDAVELTGSWTTDRGDRWAVRAGVGWLQGAGFVPGEDGPTARIDVQWTGGGMNPLRGGGP